MKNAVLPLLLALLAATPALAEKADRTKPFVVTAERQGVIDGVVQRTELSGNVVLSKGSLLLKAEKVDLRETRDGFHQAYATGATGKPVSFHQNRDTPGEAIDGVADQLEYDTRSDTVRFVGNATVRRMRGTVVAEEVTGAVIVYNNRTEVVTLEGGSASPNPNGRVRIVMMPRGAAAAEGAASAPPLPLQPSTQLPTGKQPS